MLLNLSPAIEYIAKHLKKKLKKTEKSNAAIYKMLDLIEAVKIDESGGKVTLKDTLKHIKRTVPKVYEQASYFISMKKIVEKMTEVLGFSPFIGGRYTEAYGSYMKEIISCIQEHNDIMKSLKRKRIYQAANLDKYLIPEPTSFTDVFQIWDRRLFEGTKYYRKNGEGA